MYESSFIFIFRCFYFLSLYPLILRAQIIDGIIS